MHCARAAQACVGRMRRTAYTLASSYYCIIHVYTCPVAVAAAPYYRTGSVCFVLHGIGNYSVLIIEGRPMDYSFTYLLFTHWMDDKPKTWYNIAETAVTKHVHTIISQSFNTWSAKDNPFCTLRRFVRDRKQRQVVCKVVCT